MNRYQFKTNINCGGCVAAITPHLNANNEIKHWEVDTNNPNKILTVDTEDLTEDTIKEIVQKAGYKAEKLSTPQ